MLIIIQFPISDARSFDPDPDLRLPLPDWPNPGTGIRPQFVNRFGRAFEQHREPDMAWPDEINFCRAKRALRFDDLGRRHVGLPGAKFRPQCVFRRLFFDGEAVARVEVGLRHHLDAPPLTELNGHKILAIASELCELPTLVPQAGRRPTATKLLRQGPALASLFALSSIGWDCADKKPRAETLVEVGNPLLVIELAPDEAEAPLAPEGFVSVPAAASLGANLSFGRLRARSGVVPMWVFQPGAANKQNARNLRLCLLRLHAEQESLDLVLKQIQRKRLLNGSEALGEEPLSAAVDRLDTYFNKKTKLINRADWGEISQSAILSAFDAAEQVTLPANRQNLVDRYQGARRQIWKKIDDYQTRRAAVRVVSVTTVNSGGTYVDKSVTVNQSGQGNIANVAEYMSNVVNQVTSNLDKSSSPDEAKALMKELVEQIAAIASKIDPKQTQRMGADVQTLSTEMVQPEPRRAWYELTLNGLKEAAEALGEIAMPIVGIVKKLMPLLLGV